MNCKDAAKYLARLVDRELSEAEVAETREHLERCGNCRDRFQFNAELRQLVRRRASRQVAPESLRARVARIVTQ